MAQQIIIHSLGRSGSNILLDCFDLSPATHCRNEPHVYPLSPVRQRILGVSFDNMDECMSQYWDEAVQWMSSRWGSRDRHHPMALPKAYYRRPLWSLGVPQALIRKKQLRKLCSLIYSDFNNNEYKLPSWMLMPHWQESTVHVFKLLSVLERHLFWISEHRPGIKIIHLVRHPLGFAQSMYRRVYEAGDKQYFHRQNLMGLEKKLRYAKEAGLNFPLTEIKTLDFFETVIWNWLIFNETIYQRYRGKHQLMTIVYEQLISDPELTLRKVFDHCQLSWSKDIENAIKKTFSRSSQLALSFRAYWPAEVQKSADDILSGSSIMSLWSKLLWDRLDHLTDMQGNDPVTYRPY